MGWELTWMEWANGRWSSPGLDRVLPWLTHLGSLIAVLLFILTVLIWTKRKKIFLRLALLYGIESVLLYGLKFLIRRPRPPAYLWTASHLPRGSSEILDPSFPSAHAFFAFFMATLLATWFPRYRLFFFVMAGLVGWTRIYLGLHYPTDVVAGGLLGYGLTRLFLHQFDLKIDSNS